MPNVVEQLIIEIGGDSKKFKNAINDMQKANRSAEASFKSFAKAGAAAFVAVGGAATALGVTATKAFQKFETGVTSVAKTTNLSGKELDDFKLRIIAMSEEIPVTTDKLLEIATAAGQLGIKGTENLSKFTETIAKLGATTDVEGEVAALSIARILNLTNESIDTVDKLGSTLVDLGNNFAASESEILTVATDVAKAVVQFGLSSDEILGISASMASLGIEAEAGGTVIGKAFQSINEAIRSQAGPAFEKLMELTGMTKESLTETFQKNASEVFTSFIQGLGTAGDAGKDLTEILGKLGLSGIRVEKILPSLASRSDLFGDAMDRAAGKTKNASALADESAKAFDTANNRLIVSQSKLNNLLVEIGETITPEIVAAVEKIAETARNSEPAIRGLAQSFSFVAISTIELISGLQEIARLIRVVASFDDQFNRSMHQTIAQEEYLDELLKKRGITMEQFRAEQSKLRAERKKATEEAVKNALIEADAQTARTSAFLKSTSNYIATETKRTTAGKTESEKRIDQEKKAESILTEIKKQGIEEQGKEKQKALKKELDDAIKADQEMFNEINRSSNEIVANYEFSKNDIEEINTEKWNNLSDLQKNAYIAEIDKAASHAMEMGELERAGELKRYKAKLQGQNKEFDTWDEFLKKTRNLQERHGVVMGALTAVQQDARYNITKTGMDEIAKLINSENNELKQIGKAATLVQIAISTIEGAQKAYASLAWIPYVGVPLGIASAAVVAAYGLEQGNKVRAMKTGGVFGTQGKNSIVPGVGTGDKVNAILEPGELVVPRKMTKDIMKEYGVRKFADGGVAGEEQATSLHSTFAQIFKVPAIFKALIAGKESKTNVSGFGANSFDGMVPAMMDALRESAYAMQDEALSVVPGGPLLAALQRLINKPIDELHDVMQDNAVTKWIGDNLGSDAAKVLTGGGPLQDAIDNELNKAIDDINKKFLKAFGFQDGGVPGMVAPGEMRLSKNALQAIAGGVNASRNMGVQSRPAIARSSSGGGTQRTIVGVEISMKDNAAEILNAQIREGNILGVLYK